MRCSKHGIWDYLQCAISGSAMGYTVYGLPVTTFLRKSLVLASGLLAGTCLVTYIFDPMKDLNEAYEKGQLELLQKYNALYKEQRLAAMGEAKPSEEIKTNAVTQRGRGW